MWAPIEGCQSCGMPFGTFLESASLRNSSKVASKMEGGKTGGGGVGDAHRLCSGNATCSTVSPVIVSNSCCMPSQAESSLARSGAWQYCRKPTFGALIGRCHLEGKPAARLRGNEQGRWSESIAICEIIDVGHGDLFVSRSSRNPYAPPLCALLVRLAIARSVFSFRPISSVPCSDGGGASGAGLKIVSGSGVGTRQAAISLI